jgi:ATP-binding cassette subfamily B protein
MHGRGGPPWARTTDAQAQRAKNADAPDIPNLFPRIAKLFVDYKPQLVLVVALVLTASALTVIPPLLIQQLFNQGLFPATGGVNFPLVGQLVATMILIWVVSAGLGVWTTYLTESVGNKVMGTLRVKLFSHLQSMELAFFTRNKTGAIQSRLQNDVGGVSSVLSNTVSSVLGNTTTVIAAFVAMLLLSWPLTIVAVIMLPLMVFAQRKVGQIRARIATKTQESLAEMNSITQEALSVSGIMLSKSFSQADAETARYDSENHNQIHLQVRQTMTGQWFFAMVQIFLSSIPAIIYVFAGLLLTNNVPLTIGTIVAFTTVQNRLLFPMMGLMQVALDLQTSQALFARIFQYLDLKPAITDAPDATTVDPSRVGEIALDHVTFRYPESEPEAGPTLKDIDLRIEPGQFVAFVGPSGSGKTTISYLIPRLYDVTDGAVTFAGTDVRQLQHDSLMSYIGVVSQETYLFHSTIAENLRYAKPDATDEELERVAREANIHDTIVSFPRGYETVVGERGYRLSGGEKQRIAIARVLLKDPSIMILDEATSALDTVSERIVQETLDRASRNRTTIAIAHRLSTIINADVIFVIDKGRIVERGSHDELLASNGVYAKLVAEQLNT